MAWSLDEGLISGERHPKVKVDSEWYLRVVLGLDFLAWWQALQISQTFNMAFGHARCVLDVNIWWIVTIIWITRKMANSVFCIELILVWKLAESVLQKLCKLTYCLKNPSNLRRGMHLDRNINNTFLWVSNQKNNFHVEISDLICFNDSPWH